MGNCSVLRLMRGSVRRVCLIDLGLSPRRTIKLLAKLGLRLDHIDDAIVTHLDGDHYHGGWARALPRHARLWLYREHLDFSSGAPLPKHVAPFDGPFSLVAGEGAVRVHPLVMDHDILGTSALRFDAEPEFGGGTLGFATDLGRVTGRLIDHFRLGRASEDDHGVDVLAIESNYCPKMQVESSRPEVLKRRIMGGRGHLSNDQAAAAIRRINPREHVVLLHLSQECNHVNVVADLHAGADYALTITSQDQPTRWVEVRGNGEGRAVRSGPSVRGLFDAMKMR
jgi:hypothetical protein